MGDIYGAEAAFGRAFPQLVLTSPPSSPNGNPYDIGRHRHLESSYFLQPQAPIQHSSTHSYLLIILTDFTQFSSWLLRYVYSELL